MNGLMIAFAFGLPYHLMQTAAAAGVRVHVLGSGPSCGLRTSRFCASHSRSVATGSSDDDHEILLEEIRDIVRRRRIDVVFPSDDVSTRLLAAIRDRLPVRATPLPDVATFDLLNDKWNFTRFARDHGVRVPQGWLYDDPVKLRGELQSGELPYPVTVKPINRSGGIGVIHIRDASELGHLDGVDYRPILVQQHIVGETIGISVVCRDGRILAHATQRRDDRRFELFANPDLVENVRRLVAATRYNGPANMDVVQEAGSGLNYIVECNPRFWFTIHLSMIVGMNFFDFALAEPGDAAARPPASLAGVGMRLSTKAILRDLTGATRQEWKLLGYRFGDPLTYLARRLGRFADGEIAVSVDRMSAYQPGGATAAAVLHHPPVRRASALSRAGQMPAPAIAAQQASAAQLYD